MNSKTKFTLMVTAMVAVTLFAIVGIMAVFAARQQTFSTSITVVYKSTNVEGTASAQWKLGTATYDGTCNFYGEEWQNMDDNGANEGGNTKLDLSTGSTLSLSPSQSIELSDEYPGVVFKYTFTNTATHPYTLNFKYQPTTATNNINTFYAATSQEMDDSSLNNIANNFTDTLETTVLGESTENIYIVLIVDDWGSNSSFEGTFNVQLTGQTNDYLEDYVYLYDGTSAMLTGLANPAATTLDTTGLTHKDAPVTKIGNCAFQNNTNLQTVILNGIEEIGSHAFDGCSSLEILTIGEDVQFAGMDAFINLTNLTNLNFNAINVTMNCSNGLFRSAGQSSGGFAVVIGDKVTSIPGYFLQIGGGPSNWYPKISSLTLGQNIEVVGNHALALSILTGPLVLPNLREIGDSAFSFSNISSVVIPSTVKIIGPGSFSGCQNLDSVTIEKGVTTIRYSAFNSCVKLSSIEIPESVTTIERMAFSNSGLTEINIPDTVTYLGEGAFGNCRELENITIGKGLKEIDSGVFENLRKLKTFTFNAENLPYEWGGVNCDNFFGEETGIDGDGIAVTLGENVRLIPNWMFRGSFDRDPKITSANINSVAVYKQLTGANSEIVGGLLVCIEKYNGTLKVKTDIVDGNDMPEYLQTNYTKGAAADGYYTFTKIASD